MWPVSIFAPTNAIRFAQLQTEFNCFHSMRAIIVYFCVRSRLYGMTVSHNTCTIIIVMHKKRTNV